MHFYIDVVGSCNLKCPSCPIGNSKNNNAKGSMPVSLLQAIIAKAKSETQITSIGLYNWTEPLIHPEIGNLIRSVESEGIPCLVSTNLNLKKGIDDTIRAEPSLLRISVSGYSNETYSRGHVGGNALAVRENMKLLSELREQYSSKTNVQVYYHRYLDNQDDEFMMKSFSESLGFSFSSSFAVMMPLEKTLDIANNGTSKLSIEDKTTLSRLALPFPEVTKSTSQLSDIECKLKSDMITLDCKGNVVLCCTVFDQDKYNLGSYLDRPIGDFQELKNSDTKCSETCRDCTKHGLHVYYQYPDSDGLRRAASVNSLTFHAHRLGLEIQ